MADNQAFYSKTPQLHNLLGK